MFYRNTIFLKVFSDFLRQSEATISICVWGVCVCICLWLTSSGGTRIYWLINYFCGGIERAKCVGVGASKILPKNGWFCNFFLLTGGARRVGEGQTKTPVPPLGNSTLSLPQSKRAKSFHYNKMTAFITEDEIRPKTVRHHNNLSTFLYQFWLIMENW